MRIKDKDFEIYISEEKIQAKVKELGSIISSDYKGMDPIFIPILNGAFLFAADLMKHISIPCQISFIKSTSYKGTQSSGTLSNYFGLDIDIKNRHIILVDDIVDTGLTMWSIREKLQENQPASTEISSLLLKPNALEKPLNLKYVGFEIPDNFVVGYGLDYDGYGRNLKDIYQIKS